jgi:formimidoylglutamate deiminase
VTRDEMAEVVAAGAGPLHIHAAEQLQEVEQCVAATGLRPVEWLLDHADLDPRWCIVHATHLAATELSGLAASGAVAGLAPTTEADLGDGVFPGPAFLRAGGRFGVGSDSNTVIDPFAELRQFEWSQRLLHRRRNVLAGARSPERSIGTALWTMAAQGGAQALGQPVGAIAAGRRADLVVLDPDEPALAGHAAADVLDAAIFGPARRPVRDVMTAGVWIVRAGVHAQADRTLARFRAALTRVLG